MGFFLVTRLRHGAYPRTAFSFPDRRLLGAERKSSWEKNRRTCAPTTSPENGRRQASPAGIGCAWISSDVGVTSHRSSPDNGFVTERAPLVDVTLVTSDQVRAGLSIALLL